MCETSQRLFPRLPLCISTRYTLGKGRHIYKFGIDLSLLSRYIDTKLLQMLVSERQFWDPAHVFYTIDVNFKRYGSFRRQCHKTISLISRRLDPPTIPSSLYYGRSFLQSYRAITCDMLEIADEPQRTKNESLPLYSPALVLRAGIISGDRLWQTGEFLGLKLWITVPYGISKQLKLCLQSVRLSLINATVHNMQDHGRTLDLTGTVIATIRRVMFLNTKPDEDTIEIDSSTWRSSTESLQSLAAFTVTGQDSLLQVLCEFSSDKMMNNMVSAFLGHNMMAKTVH